MRPKLKELSEALEKEIDKLATFAKETKNSANEISKTAAGSMSAAGDRFHSEAQARIAEENLHNIQKLKKEIDSSLNKDVPKVVEPVCFMRISMAGSEQELYFVGNPVFLSGFKLVSSSSPLGQAIKGKKVGEKFDFGEGGKILSIG